MRDLKIVVKNENGKNVYDKLETKILTKFFNNNSLITKREIITKKEKFDCFLFSFFV